MHFRVSLIPSFHFLEDSLTTTRKTALTYESRQSTAKYALLELSQSMRQLFFYCSTCLSVLCMELFFLMAAKLVCFICVYVKGINIMVTEKQRKQNAPSFKVNTLYEA